MDIFKGQNLLEFSDRFKTNLDCKEYLSDLKEETDYKCLKCNHKAYQRKADFSRQCNVCNHRESATANTLFHKVKFGLRKARSSFVLKCQQAQRVCRLAICPFALVLQKQQLVYLC